MISVSTCSTYPERNLIELDIGRLGLARVSAYPAARITPDDWSTVVAARRSYKMWCGEELFEFMREDPFDGRAQYAGWYHTTHYIGSISTPGKQDKVITVRRVGPNRTVPAAPLIEDLAFWSVYDSRSNTAAPLAEWLDDYSSIAGLSRAATLPFTSGGVHDIDDRNRSAVVYALIQVAATADAQAYRLYAGQICEEFRSSVFALHLPNNTRLEIDLPPALQTLGLATDRYTVMLNRENSTVRGLIRGAPGFWLDNSSLARALICTLESGLLTTHDLSRVALAVLNAGLSRHVSERDAGLLDRIAAGETRTASESQRAATLFASPRLAKYLAEQLCERGDFWSYIMSEVPDGPYVFLVRPQNLLESAMRLLTAAREVYA